MHGYVLNLEDIELRDSGLVGGKAAQLAELARIPDIRVPRGFCVTTAVFRDLVARAPALETLLHRLSRVHADEGEAIRELAARCRRTIETVAIAADVSTSIALQLARFPGDARFAVRSSATAEDLPTASFAGQHDTFLDVAAASIPEHVRRCCASLFSERAVVYRRKSGFDHRSVQMAVIVQEMVFAQAAGVLFTADPISGHRKMAVIEAASGPGEAVVSGLVNPDVYKLAGDEVIEKAGGTGQIATVLTDARAQRLAQLGRRIEAHFGRPQDIEWCLEQDEFFIVQSRPITTLFPVPEAGDEENHVYVSVGHQQMMTDAMRPLGISFWQMTTPRPMAVAGGRLFVDVTPMLASPASRAGLLAMLGRSDPLIGDALRTILDRAGFLPSLPDPAAGAAATSTAAPPLETDPAIVAGLIERSQSSVARMKAAIASKSGVALLDFIRDDIEELKRILFDPRSHQAIMAGMEAAWWLNDTLQAWLGETNAADALTQSVANNVTSAMGLALLDVADVIRAYPDVVAYLERAGEESDLDELSGIRGGPEVRAAIETWLAQYGMRGVGEIDITRQRWSERPALLVPLLLGHVRNCQPGAAKTRFERGLLEAETKAEDLLERVRALPDGEVKAAETKRMIDRVRTFSGYREYPKYGMVSRYFVYKQALMEEAGRLVRAGVLREQEDIFYLTFDELHEVVRLRRVDHTLLRERKDAFRADQTLTPPRVLTSEGEVVTGAYRRDHLPADALIGLAVSSGTSEGRARVVLDMTRANLQPGDILVTRYTDPSWTPLFVAVAGLVTEVGGLMTHGAVIAREYGLPAVVGVERATHLIRDGQRIRVHGREGYVEILS